MQKYLTKYKNEKKLGFNATFIILSLLGFFIGRVSIFHMLNPIAIAYLGCVLLSGKMFNLALGFTFLGFFSKIDSFYILKYIVCLSMLFLINIIFSKSKKRENIIFKAILCSLSIFISGVIVSILNEFSPYYFVLAVFETILTFCMVFILNKGIYYINKQNKDVISTEEIISLGIFIGSIICGSSGIFRGYIFYIFFYYNIAIICMLYIW